VKIGPFVIYRQRTTANGLTIQPWHRLTEERLSPEVKAIVAKMARSACKDAADEVREKLLTDLTEFYQGLTTAIELDVKEQE
jgi:hypothetical protein